MKNLMLLLLVGSFTVGLFAAEAEILSLSGTSVEIKEPGGTWQPASPGQVVSVNSMIATGFNSEVELSVGGMQLSLSPLTRVSIDSLTDEGDAVKSSLSLGAGLLRAKTAPVSERKTRRAIDFKVSTPVATAAVRGTEFILTPSKLETIEGMVELARGNSVVKAAAGSKSWVAPEAARPTEPMDNIGELITPEAIQEEIEEVDTTAATGSARITLQ